MSTTTTTHTVARIPSGNLGPDLDFSSWIQIEALFGLFQVNLYLRLEILMWSRAYCARADKEYVNHNKYRYNKQILYNDSY